MNGSPSIEGEEMVTFDLGFCRIEIEVQDPALQRRLRELSRAPEEASQAKRTLRYRIRGSGPFEIREERDRLAQVDGVERAVAMVLERGLRRAAELFALSGCAPFTGRIMLQGTRLFALIEPASYGADLLPARHLWVRGEKLFAIEVSTSTLSCKALDLPSVAAVVAIGLAPDHSRPKKPTSAELVAQLLQSSPCLGAPRSTLVRAASRLAMLPSLAVAESSVDDALSQFLPPSSPERPL